MRLRLEHCGIGALENSETSSSCVATRRMSGLAAEDICPVSAEDICPVPTADTYPVSTEDIYPVSTGDGMAAGRRPAAVMSSVETG